jgi:hypothetical protein
MAIIANSKRMHAIGSYFSLMLFVIGSMIVSMTVSPLSSVVQAAVGTAEDASEVMDEEADPGVRVAQNAEEEFEQEDEQGAAEPKSESPAVANPATPDSASSPGVDAKSDVTMEEKAEEEVEVKAEEVEVKAEEVEVKAEEVEVKAEKKAEESIQAQGVDSPRKGLYGGRFFGSSKIHFAVNKADFGAKQKCYQKMYGASNPSLSAGMDWFPKDWAINPGIMFNMAAFSAHGRAVKGSVAAGKSCSELTLDENSHTSLQYTPIQLGLKFQMSPFRRKAVVFDFWAAGELGFWQETRDAISMIRPITTGPMQVGSAPSLTSTTTSTKVYTNSGQKLGFTTGLAVHILLNALDEADVHTMVPTMGLGYAYLSFFAESVSSISSGVSFARNSIGVGFTFESVK